MEPAPRRRPGFAGLALHRRYRTVGGLLGAVREDTERARFRPGRGGSISSASTRRSAFIRRQAGPAPRLHSYEQSLTESPHMEYRVESLARAAGVSVDTVRFYQAKGLLPPPKRVGRHAVYSGAHLTRLRRIRRLQAEGVPLAVIGRLLRPARRSDTELARALAEERGGRTLTRAELAAEAGVPEALVRAVEEAGILEPLAGAQDARFAAVDVDLARAALRLLQEGLPLTELLALAIHHAENVREEVERAIDLFDRHVRRRRDGSERDPAEVVEAFRRLLPAVTALVAHYFHRTLVARALARLEQAGDREGLRHALTATRSGRLEVAWR